MARYNLRALGAAVLTFAVVALAVVALTSAFASGREDHVPVTNVDWAPAPQSLDDLIATRSLVVIGTYEGRTQFACERPYDYALFDDTLHPKDRRELWAPTTYYEFAVEEVVHADAEVGGDGGRLALRLAGHEVAGRLLGAIPAPETGERRLLVLAPNPDGASFSPITPWHAFTLEGPEVRTAPDGELVAFGQQGADDFVAALQARLRERGPSPVEQRQYPEVPGRVVQVDGPTDCRDLGDGS